LPQAEGAGEGAQKPLAVSTEKSGKAQQREFYRAAVDFPASVFTGEDDRKEQGPIAGRAHDLSGAGIRISINRSLARGQMLEVRFRIPTGKSEVVARGVVALSFFEGSSNQYHHGIAFTKISAADQDAIVHYIHELQRRELKGH